MRGMRSALIGLSVLAIVGVGVLVWYQIDRPGVLRSMCEVGLPNLSRPSGVDADQLGCVILSPKGRYSGLLITGFEASNFSSPDFPPITSELGPDDDRAWFHCPSSGCDKLDVQLDKNYLRSCIKDDLFHTGFATIEVEGWVTESAGEFGHLGAYPREFFADKIIRVSPPPRDVIDDWLDGFRRNDMCD